MRQVSPDRQLPDALPCPSHLTCRPLCTPGWPRCTRGGDSGAAARCCFGVCRTSRTSSVLRERAGGHGAPAAMSDRDLLTVWLVGAPAWGRERLSSTRVGDPLSSIRILEPGWHPHPTVAASAPPKEKDPPSPLPAHHAPEREEKRTSHLKTHGRRGRGALRERGAGQQRPLHGRGCDE